MNETPFGNFNLTATLSAGNLESSAIPGPHRICRKLKTQAMNRRQLKKIDEVLPAIPAIDESWHIVSDGTFDFWKFVPHLVSLIESADEFYGSTWTIARPNVIELFELFDSSQLKKISMLTGLYFKRRESAVYATLLSGLLERGQRFRAFRNHTKIILLAGKGNFLTVEGSANFTSNPRMEQFVITNDKPLYDFHKAWMEQMFTDE